MTDIFNETISCKDCKIEMKHTILNKQGLQLRAVECPQCKKQLIHPADLNAVENFKPLKDKTYSVKLRMVGNSHAISIPKEIVDFIRQQERIMDNMVKLCFKDMRTLDLVFGRNPAIMNPLDEIRRKNEMEEELEDEEEIY